MSPKTLRFETDCFHCHNTYDVFEARWCDCVVRESSIVCPSCGHCFCTAPASFRLQFWQKAPTGLLRDRIRELRRENERAAETATQAAETGAPLVLVIDDSRSVRGSARLTLEEAGYRVAEAGDAIEGLRLVHDQTPAMVLSDALMPRMDGREMCRIIKNDPRTSGVKVVLMTALYTGARYKAEAIRTFRVDDYIAKPVSAENLLQIVAKQLFGGAPPPAGIAAMQTAAA